MSDAVELAEAVSFDPYSEHRRLSAVANALPPPELAVVPPSLREAAAALEPAHREQLLQELGQATLGELPGTSVADAMQVVTDSFAHILLGIARAGVEQRAYIHGLRDTYSAEGYAATMADAMRSTRERANAAHAKLDQELDRIEQAASAELARHSAEAFAHPELELAVRARFADAFGSGAAAVQDLFDAHLAAGDATAARVLAQVATSTLAAVPQDDPRWGQARNLQPLAQAFAQSLKPATVRRAEEQRIAVGATRQRLEQLRGLIGV